MGLSDLVEKKIDLNFQSPNSEISSPLSYILAYSSMTQPMLSILARNGYVFPSIEPKGSDADKLIAQNYPVYLFNVLYSRNLSWIRNFLPKDNEEPNLLLEYKFCIIKKNLNEAI